MKKLIFFIIIFFIFSKTLFCQELISSKSFLTVQKNVQITLKNVQKNLLNKVVLTAEYRPNSATSIVKTINNKINSDTWQFVPEKPGLVLLKASIPASKEASKTAKLKTLASLQLSVCFAHKPLSGIFVMLFAAIILFGGIAISIGYALKSNVE